jgi:hypothetical protein
VDSAPLDLLNALGDRVSMIGAESHNSANQQIEGTLRKIGFGLSFPVRIIRAGCLRDAGAVA